MREGFSACTGVCLILLESVVHGSGSEDDSMGGMDREGKSEGREGNLPGEVDAQSREISSTVASTGHVISGINIGRGIQIPPHPETCR